MAEQKVLGLAAAPGLQALPAPSAGIAALEATLAEQRAAYTARVKNLSQQLRNQQSSIQQQRINSTRKRAEDVVAERGEKKRRLDENLALQTQLETKIAEVAQFQAQNADAKATLAERAATIDEQKNQIETLTREAKDLTTGRPLAEIVATLNADLARQRVLNDTQRTQLVQAEINFLREQNSLLDALQTELNPARAWYELHRAEAKGEVERLTTLQGRLDIRVPEEKTVFEDLKSLIDEFTTVLVPGRASSAQSGGGGEVGSGVGAVTSLRASVGRASEQKGANVPISSSGVSAPQRSLSDQPVAERALSQSFQPSATSLVAPSGPSAAGVSVAPRQSLDFGLPERKQVQPLGSGAELPVNQRAPSTPLTSAQPKPQVAQPSKKSRRKQKGGGKRTSQEGQGGPPSKSSRSSIESSPGAQEAGEEDLAAASPEEEEEEAQPPLE